MLNEKTTNEGIALLMKKFKTIKNLGYIKGTKQGNIGNSGLTFENLIGKENDEFPFADFEGVEIKVRSHFSNKDLTLFNLVPSNNFGGIELKRLREEYGFYDEDFKDKKKLHFLIIANKKINMHDDYYATMKVDYENQKLRLFIYKGFKLVDDRIYWDFYEIERAVNNKLNNLAIVKYYKRIINGERYFRYDEITLYKLKSFDTFLNMIDMGYITLYINLGIYKSGIKKGQCHDYGVRFDIKEKYIPMIYDKLAR